MRTEPEPRSPWPQRTTYWTGALLLAAGLLGLLDAGHAAVAVTEQFVVPLSGPGAAVGAAVLHAVALVVAALGIAGEIGVAGALRWGRVALLTTALLGAALALQGVLVQDVPPPPVSAAISLAYLLVLVGGVAAGLAVVRARVLSGPARWALLATALLMVLLDAAGSTPLAIPLLLTWPTEYLMPAATVLTGLAFLLWGRTEAVKHRARVIHDAW